MAAFDFFITLIIVNEENGPLNIKEANTQSGIYVGKVLTLHIVCFMVIELHNLNASVG